MNKKIITKFIAILLLAMCTMPAFSQFRFGVRAEVGLYNPTLGEITSLQAENLTSFSVGPTLELMIPLINFGIETSLLYNNHRMRVSGDDVADIDVTNHYLLLPVNAKKKFGLGVLPVQLFATAGPYIGFLLSGDDVRVSEPTSARSPNIIVDDAQARSFQAGIGLGFGVEVLRRLQVGVQYRLQLTDNYDVSESVLGNVINPLNDRTSTWNLSATIFF